jgi:hypothetical protein
MRSMLAVSEWFLGAATLAVGALLTLVLEGIRRRWSRSDAISASQAEKQRRAEEQSDAAAREILREISEIRTLYVKHPLRLQNGEWQGGPGSYYLPPVLEQIASHAVDVRDSAVRRRLELAIDALRSRGMIRELTGIGEYQVMWRSTEVARNAIGAMLRGEALSDDAGFLEEWEQAVSDVFSEDD